MELIIEWILSNFSLFMLFVGLIAFLIIKVTKRKKNTYEALYQCIAFFPLGLSSLYAFMMHAFFADFTAASIGWQNTPFQFEVAMANLAIGVIALVSVYRSYDFRLATVIATTCWLGGDALGHLYQMIVHHNFTVGNAGSWLYMDILIPVLLIICIINLPRIKRYS